MSLLYPAPYHVEKPDQYVLVKRAFTKRECGALVGYAESIGMNHQTKSRWGEETIDMWWAALFPDEFPNIYARLAELYVRHNIWRFALSGFVEAINVFKYEVGGWIRTHSDCDLRHDQENKLSGVTLLTDPSTYQGGQLVVAETVRPKLGQGDLIIYPSYTLHRVEKLTKGLRYVMAGFLAGPRFV